jgi:DNA-binding MarR family transcriptional regulator
VESTPFDLVVRLAGAHAAVVRQLDEELGEGHGLSFDDFLLLLHLDAAAGGRLRRADLAGRMRRSTLAVTRALGPLERIGLVRHEPNPHDPRAAEALLTPAGRQIVADARVTAAGACRRLFAAGGTWPEEEMDRFASFLARLGGEVVPPGWSGYGLGMFGPGGGAGTLPGAG